MEEKNLMDELDIIKRSIGEHTGSDGSPFNTSKDQLNNVLSSIQGEKIDSIQKVINEINEMINERNQLSQKVIAEIDKISTKVDSMLLQAVGNPDNYREQVSLKEKQILIEEAKVREMVECWRDIANLKRELRERIKEFSDQESKINVMENILKK